MTDKKPDIRFDSPLYTVAEAARALSVPASTLATWASGYGRPHPGKKATKADAIVTAFPSPPGIPSIPFVGLAEGMVLAAVRRAGVPMPRVRPALVQLAQEIGLSHALASRRLYTDGAEILFDYSKNRPSLEADLIGDLVVVRSGQRAFSEVITHYLQRITYGSDGYASMIRLPGYTQAEVIADPARAFGQSIFSRGAARVSDVLERFWSGYDIESLSQEFGVPTADIEDVLRAASHLAA